MRSGCPSTWRAIAPTRDEEGIAGKGGECAAGSFSLTRAFSTTALRKGGLLLVPSLGLHPPLSSEVAPLARFCLTFEISCPIIFPSDAELRGPNAQAAAEYETHLHPPGDHNRGKLFFFSTIPSWSLRPG